MAAVLALALGTVLRDSAGAVTAVVAGIVLPYLVTVALPVLPPAAADWLLRLTPAAAFAIQQSAPEYPQVNATYLPFFGYFPLTPLGRNGRTVRMDSSSPGPGGFPPVPPRCLTAPEGRVRRGRPPPP